jgi:hypothetical protein
MQGARGLAAGLHCLEQRLGFGFKPRHGSAGGGHLAFRAIPPSRCLRSAGLRSAQRLARIGKPGLGLLAPGAGRLPCLQQWCLAAKFVHHGLQPGEFRRGPAPLGPRRIERGARHPGPGLLGGLPGARPAERRFRFVRAGLQFDGARVDRSARRLSRREARRDGGLLPLQPGKRRPSILSQSSFPLTIGKQGGAAVGQLPDPARCRIPLNP